MGRQDALLKVLTGNWKQAIAKSYNGLHFKLWKRVDIQKPLEIANEIMSHWKWHFTKLNLAEI